MTEDKQETVLFIGGIADGRYEQVYTRQTVVAIHTDATRQAYIILADSASKSIAGMTEFYRRETICCPSGVIRIFVCQNMSFGNMLDCLIQKYQASDTNAEHVPHLERYRAMYFLAELQPVRLNKQTREVLCHMFFDGPIWDGNLVSKVGRDNLVDLNLAGSGSRIQLYHISRNHRCRSFGIYRA